MSTPPSSEPSSLPSSLTDGHLDPVWEIVRDRLERRGTGNRGRVGLPALSSKARLALRAVTDRAVGATLDLGVLEQGLGDLGLGPDLPAALAALGHPVSDEPAQRRADRRLAEQARSAARVEASGWDEAWSDEWVGGLIARGGLSGLDPAGAVGVVRAVRAVLDKLAVTQLAGPVSRTDLAADVLGSAHALDAGTRLEAAVTRALAHAVGVVPDRELWERAGAHLDLVSGPVLTWNLMPSPGPGLARLAGEAGDLGIPLHLTQLALRRAPVVVPAATVVLVVENPRVVEAAAQAGSPMTVVATNGNPSGAVRLLLDQFLGAGAALRYHGDFDAAGLAMCARMHRRGLVPWRMGAADYLAGLDHARRAGVDLPLDGRRSPPTPWDEALQATFDRHRSVVHEERLLPGLLDL